jgi:hypothetical protein
VFALQMTNLVTSFGLSMRLSQRIIRRAGEKSIANNSRAVASYASPRAYALISGVCNYELSKMRDAKTGG